MIKRGLSMSKKGNLLTGQVLYVVLFLVFFIGAFYFVTMYQDGASVWEEIYAKEIAMLINGVGDGTKVSLDVTELSEIAVKNGKSVNEMIVIDNVNNVVRVSLRQGKATSFGFFNDVDIIEPRIELFSDKSGVNMFVFEVRGKNKENEDGIA
jgi:hypothetical protein